MLGGAVVAGPTLPKEEAPGASSSFQPWMLPSKLWLQAKGTGHNVRCLAGPDIGSRVSGEPGYYRSGFWAMQMMAVPTGRLNQRRICDSVQVTPLRTAFSSGGAGSISTW